MTFLYNSVPLYKLIILLTSLIIKIIKLKRKADSKKVSKQGFIIVHFILDICGKFFELLVRDSGIFTVTRILQFQTTVCFDKQIVGGKVCSSLQLGY
jgi:cytochrome c oxidase assembly protein Cox11